MQNEEIQAILDRAYYEYCEKVNPYGKNLTVGCNVEIHPGYDLWMMGDRFGKVLKIDLDKQTAKVKMRITQRQELFPLQDLKRTL